MTTAHLQGKARAMRYFVLTLVLLALAGCSPTPDALGSDEDTCIPDSDQDLYQVRTVSLDTCLGPSNEGTELLGDVHPASWFLTASTTDPECASPTLNRNGCHTTKVTRCFPTETTGFMMEYTTRLVWNGTTQDVVAEGTQIMNGIEIPSLAPTCQVISHVEVKLP